MTGFSKHCCCVPSCLKYRDKNVTSVRFPWKDKDMFHTWLKIINNPKFVGLSIRDVYDRFRICTSHFETKWFAPPGAKQRLIRGATPTLFLTKEENWAQFKFLKKFSTNTPEKTTNEDKLENKIENEKNTDVNNIPSVEQTKNEDKLENKIQNEKNTDLNNIPSVEKAPNEVMLKDKTENEKTGVNNLPTAEKTPALPVERTLSFIIQPSTRKCAVENCQSNAFTKGKTAFIYCFPKNDKMRTKWLAKIQREDLKNQKSFKNLGVCGRHFSKHHFKYGNQLLRNAVPNPIFKEGTEYVNSKIESDNLSTEKNYSEDSNKSLLENNISITNNSSTIINDFNEIFHPNEDINRLSVRSKYNTKPIKTYSRTSNINKMTAEDIKDSKLVKNTSKQIQVANKNNSVERLKLITSAQKRIGKTFSDLLKDQSSGSCSSRKIKALENLNLKLFASAHKNLELLKQKSSDYSPRKNTVSGNSDMKSVTTLQNNIELIESQSANICSSNQKIIPNNLNYVEPDRTIKTKEMNETAVPIKLPNNKYFLSSSTSSIPEPSDFIQLHKSHSSCRIFGIRLLN